MFNFNPRSPRGERRNTITNNVIRLLISIHALREESDLWNIGTLAVCVTAISIHALREESDKAAYALDWLNVISIHALREESDSAGEADSFFFSPISIHALREESDLVRLKMLLAGVNFNPRSP